MGEGELRCSRCEALVTAEAEWCGQCYEPLHVPAGLPVEAPSGSPAAVTGGGAAIAPGLTVGPAGIERTDAGATWACPVCGERNAMSLNFCNACDTPFARLFQEPGSEREREPSVEPRSALAWSILLPGLGHWRLGRKFDAVARIVLFGWTFGTIVVLALSSSGNGLGSATLLFLLFLGATVLLWVLSAVDAYRIASEEDPIVSSRALLWASAALVLASALIATLVALPAARGR